MNENERSAFEQIYPDQKRPLKRLGWQEQRNPAQCDHQHEVIAHDNGLAINACTLCGALDHQDDREVNL